MKKIILTLLLVTGYLGLISQPAGKWATTGNSTDPGDFIGTLNNASFDFRVNNVQKMSLGTSGVLNLNSLSGTGNRILRTDANGNISALPSGGSGEFLQSDGTWGNLPSSATVWQLNGSNLSFVGGNLGIGTSSPIYKLDVTGDARISNNLFVSNDLNVSGSVMAGQGLNFDNINGMKYYSTDAGNTIMFGNRLVQPMAVPCAAPNNPSINMQLSGNMQLFNPSVSNSGLLNFQTWANGTSIDGSVSGNTGNQALLINYFCGNNTGINTGSIGGIVFLGQKVDMAGSVKIGFSGNSTFDPNTSMEFYNVSNPTWNGIKFITPWNGARVISIDNSNFTLSPFTVFADGRTGIGTDYVPGGFMLSVNGKMICEEVNVALRASWPDYVFAKEYNLMPLSKLKTLIEKKQGLLNMPTAKEVEKNGATLGEIARVTVEKTEEAFLYLIQHDEKIEKLERENKELKNELLEMKKEITELWKEIKSEKNK